MSNPFRSIRVFWGEMIRELKKASWPTRKELQNYTVIVLIATALLGAFTSLSDFAVQNVVQLFTSWVSN